MSFTINFLDNQNVELGSIGEVISAQITINEFSEALQIPLEYWSISDYVQQ